MTFSLPVSVITTVLNGEKYLEESLDSLKAQTCDEFEVIFVNDGSTDRTVEIIQQYMGNFRRTKFLNFNDNKRIPTRRNQAIEQARGEFIVIHDGDDSSYPDRIERQLTFMRDNQDIFCVGGHAIKMDLASKVFGEMAYPPKTHAEIVDMTSKQCMNPIIDPTTMFRRQDFLNLGKYTLEKAIYTVPDFDLWCKAIIAECRFANLQEPLIKYRENPDGMTGRHKQEMIRSHMIVWTRFMERRQKPLRYGRNVIPVFSQK